MFIEPRKARIFAEAHYNTATMERILMKNLAKALSLAVLTSTVAFGQQSTSCSDLMKMRIPGVAIEFTKAEKISAAATPAAGQRGAPAVPLPSYCRLDGVIDRRVGAEGKEYGIGFAVALPDNWNGRFLMQGGGGLNGTVRNPFGLQATGGNPGL